MSDATATELAKFKADLEAAAKAGHSEATVILEHATEHFVAALKDLHPDIAAIEADAKPLVTELVTYAFGLIPGAPWLGFLEPQVENVVNHQLDVALRKLFPAAT